MQRILMRLIVSLAGLQLMIATAQAQLIQVRPGYVRAPFVRVYSYPGGGSYVRAPFVGVGSPPFRSRARYRQVVPYPAVTTTTPVTDVTQLDWLQLRRTIRSSASSLDNLFSRIPTGNFWKSHFQTSSILKLVAADVDGPPTPEQREQLGKLLATMEAASTDADFDGVRGQASFRTLQAALAEFLAPPEQRARRQLADSARRLTTALERFNTGQTWIEYLQFPPGLDAVAIRDTGEVAPPPDVEVLSKTLQRFESVRQNDEYDMISGLPEFQATERQLAAYLALREDPQQVNASVIEEIPPPTPQK